MSEQLSAQQLKAYASKTRIKLLEQLRNLESKEIREAEQVRFEADEPERFRVNKMKVVQIKLELRQYNLVSKGVRQVLVGRLVHFLLLNK